LDDVLRGAAVLQFFCGWMFGNVYSSLLDIAVQCDIEDGLKIKFAEDGVGREMKWGRRAAS
jgi:hypothetical protein